MVDKLAQRAQAILNTPVYYYLGYKTVSYRVIINVGCWHKALIAIGQSMSALPG